MNRGYLRLIIHILSKIADYFCIKTVSIPRFVMPQNRPLCWGAHNVNIMVTDIDGARPLTAGISHPRAATVPAAAQRQQHQAGC